MTILASLIKREIDKKYSSLVCDSFSQLHKVSFIVIGEATFEEYVASVKENNSSPENLIENARYYKVLMD